MTNRFLPLAAAAAFALSACGQQAPEELDTRAPDPLASQLANRAPVELPPAVKASVTFRCKDNSLVYVDFFEGDKLANFRAKQGDAPVRVSAETAGEPMTGEGYTVSGTPSRIELTQPGKSQQTCNA